MPDDNEETSFNATRLEANGKKIASSTDFSGGKGMLRQLQLRAGDFPAAREYATYVRTEMGKLASNLENLSRAVQQIGMAVTKASRELAVVEKDNVRKSDAINELAVKVDQMMAKQPVADPGGGSADAAPLTPLNQPPNTEKDPPKRHVDAGHSPGG
nr:hypothetical protein [Kibdelosporangium sp. MJ126-NF4]CEL16309.1 hypothetical protein [Kibdelosporangium sp. MJ126-NF4]CTQ94233.1 hypothetical protein [Kibdelosporangium sp. MJ126-NF4]